MQPKLVTKLLEITRLTKDPHHNKNPKYKILLVLKMLMHYKKEFRHKYKTPRSDVIVVQSKYLPINCTSEHLTVSNM